MTVVLRGFLDSDHEFLAAVGGGGRPFRVSAEQARFYDAHWPDNIEQFRTVAVSESGEVLGIGQLQQFVEELAPRRYFVSILCNPWSHRPEIDRTLFVALEAEFRGRNGTTLRTAMYEDDSHLPWYTDMGFRRRLTIVMSVLDLARPDRPAIETRDIAGIEFTTLADELALGRDWLRPLAALHDLVRHDVPAVRQEEIRDLPVEYFRDFIARSPNTPADSYFLAKAGNRYIGESFVFVPSGQPNAIYQDHTGVIADYRNRHIASALKARVVGWAVQNQKRLIFTGNEEDNAPILRINERMGFTALRSLYVLERDEP